MSATTRTSDQLSALEALMLHHFRAEPFHNLRLLYGSSLESTVPGGTCSDKTLSFVSAARGAGFDVSLHTGFIGGQEIHRLARVHIDGRVFFADVGDGWPSVKLYAADRAVSYRCFGMGFRTEIANGRVTVFHERRGKDTLQLEIDVRPRPEAAIIADIDRRFTSGLVYPFSNSLRFSQVVGERFLFLRGDRLEIYEDHAFGCVEGIAEAGVPSVLREHFGVDVKLGVRLSATSRDDGKGDRCREWCS